jgi:hypothetical protein
MYSEPRLSRAPSNSVGESLVLRHTRTLQSRDAERTVSGEAKATARTCNSLALAETVRLSGCGIHQLRGRRAGLRA